MFLTCSWVQQELSIIVSGHDAVGDWIRPSTVSSQSWDTQHLRPNCQGFWQLSGVLRAQEDRLVVVQGDHVHCHRGDRVEVTRQAAIGGLHLQLKGGWGVGGQRSLQPQDPRKLIQREVAAVARQEGILDLWVYTCRRLRWRWCHLVCFQSFQYELCIGTAVIKTTSGFLPGG